MGLAEVYRIYRSWTRLVSEKPVRKLFHQSHHTANVRMSLVVLRMQKKWTGGILQRKNGRLIYLFTGFIPKRICDSIIRCTIQNNSGAQLVWLSG